MLNILQQNAVTFGGQAATGSTSVSKAWLSLKKIEFSLRLSSVQTVRLPNEWARILKEGISA